MEGRPPLLDCRERRLARRAWTGKRPRHGRAAPRRGYLSPHAFAPAWPSVIAIGAPQPHLARGPDTPGGWDRLPETSPSMPRRAATRHGPPTATRRRRARFSLSKSHGLHAATHRAGSPWSCLSVRSCWTSMWAAPSSLARPERQGSDEKKSGPWSQGSRAEFTRARRHHAPASRTQAKPRR